MKRSSLVIAALFLVTPQLCPDALVITQAMKAATIAEIFIAEGGVRVEIEIGVTDLPAFQNLLPEEILERMGISAPPLEERLGTFFLDDLKFVADGRVLPGRVLQMKPRRRVPRDEVTGEPLPVADDEGEPVIFAELFYPMPQRAAVLTMTPPYTESGGAAADLGFMAYHQGIPINDFRYLGTTETLRLDWDDPWFSKFDNRNLWRQYDSPVSAFLYVEHYEVRKEVVLRPRDLATWLDLGLDDKQVITVDEQPEIKRRAVEFLKDKNPVTIDGERREGTLDRVHFIYRTLRTSGVIDPPRDLDVNSATLGVIFYYPTAELPQEVTMEWELWSDRTDYIPTSTTDEAGALPYRLFRDDSILVWRNFLTHPTIPGLVEIGNPPRVGRVWLILPGVAALLGIGLLVLRRGKAALRGKPLAAALLLLVVSATTFPRALRPSYVAPDEGDEIVLGLLENVYRSFDYREESVIYDALERSAAGDLLTDIYLETRRSLELENQGGARAKVQQVTMVDSEHEPLGGEIGFVSTCTWNVSGSVGHWGHVHTRENQYQARFVIKSVDGLWKITDLELLQEERIPS